MMPQEPIELTRARLALRAARRALADSIRLDTWTPEIQQAFHRAEDEVEQLEMHGPDREPCTCVGASCILCDENGMRPVQS